jgi:hypothetical protein
LARTAVGAVPGRTGNAQPVAPPRDDNTALRVRASSFCGRLEADLGHHGKIILLLRSAVLTLAEQHRNPRLSNSLRQ